MRVVVVSAGHVPAMAIVLHGPRLALAQRGLAAHYCYVKRDEVSRAASVGPLEKTITFCGAFSYRLRSNYWQRCLLKTETTYRVF